MTIEYITLRSKADDLALATLITVPDPGRDAGIIQFSHGMCGCKERFLPVMKYLTGRGFVCIANDHRGHGGSIRSEKDRGYMYRGGYKALVDDMKTVSDYAGKRFPGLPLYLLGHSMGSLAARVYARKYGNGLAGLFLCGSPAKNPMSGVGMTLSWLLCAAGLGRIRPAVLQEIGSDRFNEPFKDEGWQAWTCSDPQVRKAFADNPACNFTFTANASYNLLAMMREAYSDQRTSYPGLPVFLMNGADDPCSKGVQGLSEAADMASRAGYINITTFQYPGMRHEILNEPRKEIVFEDIIKCINLIAP